MAIDNRIVSANIAKLRNHRGMTQFQLAAALNVSHQAVSKWETGAALPDIQTLLSLTQLFGVTMEELLNTEIVIREEEDMSEETQQDETEKIVFPGFLNDLIPEEAKKAIKNAAGEAKRTFIEVSGDLSARAEKTFAKATEFAEKAKNDLENRFKEASESKKQPEEPAEEAKEEPSSANKPNISLDQLIRLAPFMSREKLSDLVLRLSDNVDLESIVQIAPFLNRQTVQKLVEKCIHQKCPNQVLRRLAPFVGADALYQLIYNNLDDFDLNTLESLAPFLKRPMVDALTEYVFTGVKPDAPTQAGEEKNAKETIQDAVGSVMNEIGNMMGEIGNVVKNIFTPGSKAAQPEDSEIPEEPDVPEDSENPKTPAPPSMEETEKFIPTMEEMEKFIPSMEEIEKFTPAPEEIQPDASCANPTDAIETVARRALETGNWNWINDHAHEIKDGALLTEIALCAVSAVSQADSAAIVMKVIHRLNDESKNSIYQKVAEENAWELAVAIQTYANENQARIIIEKAAEAEGSQREDAYLAIECYAKIAPRETLAQITEKAVAEDNWVLINALTDAM